MTKIHPNTITRSSHHGQESGEEEPPTVLTVWNKSLLFNCRGFTVYDSKGDLVFRVDTYASSTRTILLMDAIGRPLLTIRRKAPYPLPLGDQWVVYEGEETRNRNARFSVRKAGKGKVLARTTGGYVVEGSYGGRSCVVYEEAEGKERRRRVAEIKRKEAVGSDVFRLEVEGGADAAVAMAIVVVLEQMYGSR